MTDLFNKIPKINRYLIPNMNNVREDAFMAMIESPKIFGKICEKSRRATKKRKGSKGNHTTEVRYDFCNFMKS